MATAWWAPLAWCHRLSTIQTCCADVPVLHCSLDETAPLYLVNSCILTANVAGPQHMWSASQRMLIVPRYRLDSFGHQCFAVMGPLTWNSLPVLSLNIFTHQPKTPFLLNIDKIYSAHWRMCHIDWHCTYIVNYTFVFCLTCLLCFNYSRSAQVPKEYPFGIGIFRSYSA